jgi:hypothetical protein
MVTKLSNVGLESGIQEPESGKNLFRIPDPGVKKAPDLDPQHRLSEAFFGISRLPEKPSVSININLAYITEKYGIWTVFSASLNSDLGIRSELRFGSV